MKYGYTDYLKTGKINKQKLEELIKSVKASKSKERVNTNSNTTIDTIYENISDFFGSFDEAFEGVSKLFNEDKNLEKSETIQNANQYDIYNKEGKILILVNAPGHSKDTIDVDFEEGVLTVSSVGFELPYKGLNIIEGNIYRGSFKRKFKIVRKVSNINYSVINGVVNIELDCVPDKVNINCY